MKKEEKIIKKEGKIMEKKYEKAVATVLLTDSSDLLTSGELDNLEGTYSDPYVLW